MNKVKEIQTLKMEQWKAGQQLLEAIGLTAADCRQIIHTQRQVEGAYAEKGQGVLLEQVTKRVF